MPVFRGVSIMSVSGQEHGEGALEEMIDEEIKSRPRSPTLLKLKWVAERLRKKAAVEERIKGGEYDLDSQKIAEALLNSSPETDD